jgi:hypothetical protein
MKLPKKSGQFLSFLLLKLPYLTNNFNGYQQRNPRFSTSLFVL